MRIIEIGWLNRCRECGNKKHSVQTERGSYRRLYEDDAVKCTVCGLNGVIQANEGYAFVLWETEEEKREAI